jgi:hypothetical protein
MGAARQIPALPFDLNSLAVVLCGPDKEIRIGGAGNVMDCAWIT